MSVVFERVAIEREYVAMVIAIYNDEGDFRLDLLRAGELPMRTAMSTPDQPDVRPEKEELLSANAEFEQALAASTNYEIKYIPVHIRLVGCGIVFVEAHKGECVLAGITLGCWDIWAFEYTYGRFCGLR